MTFLVMISCQLMDVTIGPLKVWEFLSLLVFSLYLKKIHKAFTIFYLFFIYLLVSSLFVTYINNVDYSYFSVLKSKYMITIVRFFEFFLIFVFVNSYFGIVSKSQIKINDLINKYLNYNFIFVTACLIGYLLSRLISYHFLSYGSNFRFKGFYVEGGPYGTFIATLIILEFFTFRKYLRLLVFSLALIFTYSKASYVFVSMSLLVWLFFKVKQLSPFLLPKNRLRFSLFIVFAISFSTLVVYKVGDNYVKDIGNLTSELKSRSNDTSFVMGRIAATHIGQNMVTNNPFMGVGLGNYSLVRNDPIYRGVFPKVYAWDLSGLGGILTLLLENGILGVFLFIFSFFKFFKIKRETIVYPLLFILPFLLGCQLYFVYPWLYACFYLIYLQQNKQYINNNFFVR